MAWKKIEMSETEYMIVPEDQKDFTAIIGDEEDIEVELALMVEQIDMREIDSGWDREEYHIGLFVSVVPINPIHKDLLKQSMECMGLDEPYKDKYANAWVVYRYAGGISLNVDTLVNIMDTNNMPHPEIRNEFCVKSWDEADGFVDALIKIAPAISTMAGFILDKPINHIGNLGWDIVKLYVLNRNFIWDTLKNH